MAYNVMSRYEQYWKLLKENRGKVIELHVPDEFQERVIKAIRKRKCREHALTANYYPPFIITRNPRLKDGRVLHGVIWIVQPVNPLNTI